MTNTIRFLALLAVVPSMAAAQQDVTHKRDPIEVLWRGGHGGVRLDSLARWEEVAARRATTFDAVTRVIKHHVKLPVEQSDTIVKVIYNKRFIASGRLAGQPMSRWLRCGGGLTGDHADSWRLTLAYAVFVDSVSAGASRVGVSLYATARSIDGVSTSAVSCGSTGALEREIVGKVREVVQTLER
jgi:hypothetical protein